MEHRLTHGQWKSTVEVLHHGEDVADLQVLAAHVFSAYVQCSEYADHGFGGPSVPALWRFEYNCSISWSYREGRLEYRRGNRGIYAIYRGIIVEIMSNIVGEIAVSLQYVVG